MKTRTISFRCPEELIQEMEILCKHNMIDRSGFIVQAMQSMLAGLTNQGICKPKEQVPPSPLKEDE